MFRNDNGVDWECRDWVGDGVTILAPYLVDDFLTPSPPCSPIMGSWGMAGNPYHGADHLCHALYLPVCSLIFSPSLFLFVLICFFWVQTKKTKTKIHKQN